jgi:hypothetical protein
MFFVLCFTLWGLCVTSPIFGIVTTLVIMMDDAIALKVSGGVHAGFSGNRKGRAQRDGGRKGRHVGRKNARKDCCRIYPPVYPGNLLNGNGRFNFS